MKKTILLLLLSLLPSLSFAGGDHNDDGDHHDSAMSVGMPGHSADVNRTIVVEMGDNMRFSPSQIKVEVGETIRFSVKNTGQLQHELTIGNTEELKEHAEEMSEKSGMQHQEPNMVSLKGGKTGDLIWKFDQAGSVNFACLEPGHFEAGMKGKVEVK
jgi:uncharacterized cupredoxin-like copper-binding protein